MVLKDAPTPDSAAEQPTNLDYFIVKGMQRYVETGDLEGMKYMANLICDINLGLLSSTDEAWKPVLSDLSVRHKVLHDVMLALWDHGTPEECLELSQRIKSFNFCLPTIKHTYETHQTTELPLLPFRVALYMDHIFGISTLLTDLKGPVTPDGFQLVMELGKAGKAARQSLEALRTDDRILHARLGGTVRPQDLIDVFPLSDPLAIVDLFVTDQATLAHVLTREGNTVPVTQIALGTFTREHALDLINTWNTHLVPLEITERQRQGLAEISSSLHDRLICNLVKKLNRELNIVQIAFIPDLWTASLPLHLSYICSKDITIPGVDVTKAFRLGEAFPIEYAPCLQAVAISQHQKRPRNVSTMISLIDPLSDLPGVRYAAQQIASSLPDTLKHGQYAGNEATLDKLSSNVGSANIVAIGTHGFFDAQDPTNSYLVLYDGQWTVNNIVSRPPFSSSPIFVLSACELGAISPNAWTLVEGPSSIPNALLSAGAACVLASLWPVEDIALGYVTERFIIHLGYPGWRPAAALFRAIRDLENLTKQEVVDRCDAVLNQMECDGIDDRIAQSYVLLENLRNMFEESDQANPYASAQLWGGLIIVGSGWGLPAGIVIGGMAPIQVHALRTLQARPLIAQGKFQEAIKPLEDLLPVAEGEERARILESLALARWKSRGQGEDDEVRREALDLLDKAEFAAQADQNEQLVKNINATRQKIKL